jgi:hypothetical protein
MPGREKLYGPPSRVISEKKQHKKGSYERDALFGKPATTMLTSARKARQGSLFFR